MALTLTSCANQPPAIPVGPSPAIRLRPVVELLQFRTNGSRTCMRLIIEELHMFSSLPKVPGKCSAAPTIYP